ncbi:MAG: sigma-70 family RNA polymerase sigma factor [Solirubrobacteraceae bacterium]
MGQSDWLAERFQEREDLMRSIAYRMLGSISDTDDALQEVWVRLSRADVDGVENLDAWLTTVVGRVCLNILRSRARRREEPFGVRVPDPIITGYGDCDPQGEVLLAESVGLALMVVVETLPPPERLAYVLHDMFAVPFDEIGRMLDRSATAARQLASRARRRVQGEANVPDADLTAQQPVVNAFFAAAREGDFERLVSLLDPEITLISDGTPRRAGRSVTIRGAERVARASLIGASSGRELYPAVVNGGPGAVIVENGTAVSIMGFAVVKDRIVEIDAVSDPARLAQLDLAHIITGTRREG